MKTDWKRLFDVRRFLRLRVGPRLSLAIAVLLVPVAVFFYEVYTTEQAAVDQAQQETKGIQYLASLHQLMELVAEHRTVVARLSGESEAGWLREELAQIQRESRAVVQAMEEAERKFGALFDQASAWPKLKAEWLELLTNVNSIPVATAIDRHDELFAALNKLSHQVAEDSMLLQDPNLENMYLIDMTVDALPTLFDGLARLRAYAGNALAQGSMTPEEEMRLAGQIYVVAQELAGVRTDFQNAIENAPVLRERLASVFEEFAGSVETLLADALRIERASLSTQTTGSIAQTLAMAPEEFHNDARTASQNAFMLTSIVEPALTKRLKNRLEQSKHAQMIYLGLGLLVALIAIALAVYNVRRVIGPLTHLNAVARRVSGGDKEARAHLVSADELGELAQQFDIMVDLQVQTNERIQAENDALNASVIVLLRAAAQLAKNDLTVRAPVAEDVTGPVSDAMNAMAEASARVLSSVVGISERIAQSAVEMQKQAQTVKSVSNTEVEIVEKSAAELAKAADSMLQIAKLAALCDEAGKKAMETTDRAQSAVQNTVEGITNIRETIRETEKRIKRLGERSQEISGIVDLINSISERTHILALNASMHAASAGEAGRGFAVVANEVQRLAESSREATSEISDLVKNIQVETSDTVQTMNEVTTQVVEGTKLAVRADEEMTETRNSTGELVRAVEEISASSQSQARLNQNIREESQKIQLSAQETSVNLDAQLGRAKQLVVYSETLRRSISIFKLPEGATDSASDAPDDQIDLTVIREEGVAAHA